MEVILDSTGLGTYYTEDGGFDVYAEICKLSSLRKPTYIARIVECPEDKPDKEVRHVEFDTKQLAEMALESLVASYRRNTMLF